MRRLIAIPAAMTAALLCMYSCSLDAVVATDRSGELTGLSALRVESAVSRVAVGILVDAGGWALRLRWLS